MDTIYLITKLALLSFHPDNTKVTFSKNRITFREPSVYQGLLRWGFGESRNQIFKIKDIVLDSLNLFQHENFTKADSILYSLCKSLNKLKLCYINTEEIKNLLTFLETKVSEFYNLSGKTENNIIDLEKNKLILRKWEYNDIIFLNYNFKCIFQLDLFEKTEFKEKLKMSYIKSIEQYLENKLSYS